MSAGHAYIEIPLTQGFVALIDIDDYPTVRAFTWCVQGSGRGHFYAVQSSTGGPRYMHALITGYARTDHVNGNGLDNRRTNLRPATLSQNNHNARARGKSSSLKGVSRSSGSRWRACISIKGRVTYLGSFPTEEAAAHAYDNAARKQFGEYAALNFPRPGEQSAHRPIIHKGAAA